MAKNLRRPQVRVARGPARRIAITGTPGTGKSSVAARLAPGVPCLEVYDIAQNFRAARRSGRGWVIDVPRLSRAMRRNRPVRTELVVGHLAHLLPVDSAIVLRCRPTELYRRLARARRGSAADRRENALAEALGVVADEVRAAGLPWSEIDTTARSPEELARALRARIRRTMSHPRHPIDWLREDRVAEHLLDWSQ